MAGQGQFGQDLVDAVMMKDVKKVKKVLKDGANLNYVRRGDNAIHLAARQGDLEIISALIKAGDSVNKGNQNGNTALHFVARDGRDDIVRYLIHKGADINIQNEDGDTPLHASVGYQPMDLIEYYVSIGMEVNKQNNNGDTPLHVAVSHSRDESVEALLLSDADVNVSNNQGKKAYQLARREDIADLIKTFDLLKAAKDSGYIMAEGTKLRYKDVESPLNLERVGITLESMSLDPDPRSMAVFYCRREKFENSSVTVHMEEEEEVVSDVFHFRVRDVIDEITASFTIPLYSGPSNKQQVMVKTVAGNGGAQTIANITQVEESLFCSVETVLVPETTSILVLYLCAKCEDNVIGEQAQQINSELEENFTMDIPEGAFLPDTHISLKVFDINEGESAEDETGTTDAGDGEEKGGSDNETNQQATSDVNISECGDSKENKDKDDAFLSQYTDSNELLDDETDKENIRTKGKSRKRKAKTNLMSDLFQIDVTGEQPAKNVKMQLPLTEACKNMAASDLQVVRVNEGNSKDVAILPCEPLQEGNIVNFETEHFCTFVICPKASDIAKIQLEIKNTKLRRQEARFFAMVKGEEGDDTKHVLMVECIKSDLSRRRRGHWTRKGFTQQRQKHSSNVMLAPSQEFTIELTGDAKFDTFAGETGHRKLVFSPHRASFQPYRIRLQHPYKDGKASVHIYTAVDEDELDAESVADSEIGPVTDSIRKRVVKLRIKLPLPPVEDPYGPDVEETFTHVTAGEERRGKYRVIWTKMMNFLKAKNKPVLLKQQQAKQGLYLKKMKRLMKEKEAEELLILKKKEEKEAEKKKRDQMRVEFPSSILSGSMRSLRDHKQE